MEQAILFENSALSEYCNANLPVDPEKIYLLQDVIKKFDLYLDDVLVTDRQYLEISGKGKIRVEIVKEHKEQINAEKPSIGTDSKNTARLQNYITFLENLFSEELRKRLPRWNIHDILIEKLRKYPLVTDLDSVKKKLNRHGLSLFKLPIAYERFINTLVEDSVIRYALAFLNFKEIPAAKYDHAIQLLNSMVSKLMIKYASSQVLYTNLNLLASALRTAILANKYPQNPVLPMFRIQDDIADIELAYFMLYGTKIGNQRVPVTILTGEPKSTVIERINYDMTSAGVKASIIEPQTLILGRIVLLDFKNFTHDVITGQYLQENFKTCSGRVLF